MNTYHAVETHDGGWAVVWLSSDVPLGFVSPRFDTHADALFTAYKMSRAELGRSLNLLHDAIDKLRLLPPEEPDT